MIGTDKGVMVPQSCLPRGVIFFETKCEKLVANGIFQLCTYNKKKHYDDLLNE